MHGKKKTTTGPLLLRIALILLCMTLFSTSINDERLRRSSTSRGVLRSLIKSTPSFITPTALFWILIWALLSKYLLPS